MSGWDKLYEHDLWRRWSLRQPLHITLDWINSLPRTLSTRVYDMGCGLGRHTVILSQLGIDTIASDISVNALEITRERLRQAALHATLIKSDMTIIPYPDEYFTGVLAIAVLEHNTREGIEKSIREIRRVLCRKGKVLASFLPRTHWLSKEDKRYDMLEDNTVRQWGPEKSLQHMVDEAELRELFKSFTIHWIQMQNEIFEDMRSTEIYISAEKIK